MNFLLFLSAGEIFRRGKKRGGGGRALFAPTGARAPSPRRRQSMRGTTPGRRARGREGKDRARWGRFGGGVPKAALEVTAVLFFCYSTIINICESF